MLLSIVLLLSIWVVASNAVYVRIERLNQIKRKQLMRLITELSQNNDNLVLAPEFLKLPELLTANSDLTAGVLAQILHTDSHQSRSQLIASLQHYGLPRLAKKEIYHLSSWRIYKRLWAATNLQYLAPRDTVIPFLIVALKDTSDSVRLASAQALSALASSESACGIIEHLCARRHIPWGRIVELMPDLGIKAIAPLTQSLGSQALSDDQRAVTLAALGVLNATQSELPISQNLYDANKHIRLQAAKALGKIHACSSTDKLLQTIEDAEWEVRVACSHSLGLIGDASAVHSLSTQLSDPVFWVRYNCADALTRIQPEGITALKHHSVSTDPFVRDICKLVLDRYEHFKSIGDP